MQEKYKEIRTFNLQLYKLYDIQPHCFLIQQEEYKFKEWKVKSFEYLDIHTPIGEPGEEYRIQIDYIHQTYIHEVQIHIYIDRWINRYIVIWINRYIDRYR